MAPRKSLKKRAPKRAAKKVKATKKKVVKKTKVKTGKKTAPKKAVKKAVKKALTLVAPKGRYLNKSELLNNMCCEADLERKQGKAVFEAINSIGQRELMSGRKFVIPGMARFVVKSKPARKERRGINPFTKEECVFKAKPASKTVKAYVVKAFKDC